MTMPPPRASRLTQPHTQWLREGCRKMDSQKLEPAK